MGAGEQFQRSHFGYITMSRKQPISVYVSATLSRRLRQVAQKQKRSLSATAEIAFKCFFAQVADEEARRKEAEQAAPAGV